MWFDGLPCNKANQGEGLVSAGRIEMAGAGERPLSPARCRMTASRMSAPIRSFVPAAAYDSPPPKFVVGEVMHWVSEARIAGAERKKRLNSNVDIKRAGKAHT